jgi:anti-anti-sigma factor
MMTTTSNRKKPAAVFAGDVTELVRGHEQELLARLSPLVRRQSVTLDLSAVRRMDAAGIAALISLYANARAAGYAFNVVNPSPRVAEILALVGLEPILLSHIAKIKSQSAVHFEQSAA